MWHGFVAHIGLWVPPNKRTCVAWPQVIFSGVMWWFYTELADEAFAFLDGLIVAAHIGMLTV